MPDVALRESDRKRLDGIVQKMTANGEKDEDIRFVVSDFKKKYASTSKGLPAEKVPLVESPTLRAKRKAEVENERPRKPLTTANMISEINEATGTLAGNLSFLDSPLLAGALKNIPGIGPFIPKPSEIAASTAMGPLDVATDVARFGDTGEIEALANIGVKSGLPVAGAVKYGGPVVKKAIQRIRPKAPPVMPPKAPIKPTVKAVPKVDPGDVAEENYVSKNLPSLLKKGIDQEAAEAQLRTKFRNSIDKGALNERVGKLPATKGPLKVEAAKPGPGLPPKSAPVRPADEIEGTTGLARRFEDPEMEAAGKPRIPGAPQSAKKMADEGRRLVETGEVDPKEVLERVVANGEKPTFERDVPAIQFHKTRIANEKAGLLAERAKAPTPELDLRIRQLDDETDQIAEFAQKARGEFHGMGEALQISHGVDDMAFVSLRDQGRALNLNVPLASKIEKQLQEISEKYAQAQAEIGDLRKALKENIAAMKSPLSRSGSPAKRRAEALGRLKRLGIATADFQEAGAMASKQSGAANIPGTGKVSTQVSEATRDLVNSYIREGETNIDSILKRFAQDVPGMSEDDLLVALSPQARKLRSDAMVATIEARRVMNKIKSQAEFRTLSTVGKASYVITDLLKNFQRTVNASMDISAALLQGKPALLARPGSWLKSWESVAKAGLANPRGTKAMQDRLWAELLDDPVVREAHEQGWLNLRSPGDLFSPQEEVFRGNIAHWIPGVARSDSMFASQLNQMYGDWYRKLAAIMPDNPEYKRSIGAIMNIFSGRGSGKFADMLSNPTLGWFGFAPKYAYSLAQTGTGAPLWMKGLHPRARLEAAKIYGAGLTTVYLVNKIAPLFGYKVDNDFRSVNYGMLEGPDGKKVDAYNKVTQFPRMLWSTFYGKVGNRGQYKEPGQYGFEPLLDYIHGNFSPALRDFEMISTGRIWDRHTKEMRDASLSDLAWSSTPLGVQDIKDMKERDPLSIILSFTGARPQEKERGGLKAGEKRAPGLKMPIGLQRFFGGGR